MTEHQQRVVDDESLDMALRAVVHRNPPAALGDRVRSSIEAGPPTTLATVGWRAAPWLATAAVLLALLAGAFWRSRDGAERLVTPSGSAVTEGITEAPTPVDERFDAAAPDPVSPKPVRQRSVSRARGAERLDVLAPWPVPDARLDPSAAWDGFGPPPLHELADISVHRLESGSVSIEPIRLDGLEEPAPITVQEDEES